MLGAGVIETSFADYLRTFTDQPAAALEDLVDGGGYQRQPFLKRLLPRQVRLRPHSASNTCLTSQASGGLTRMILLLDTDAMWPVPPLWAEVPPVLTCT